MRTRQWLIEWTSKFIRSLPDEPHSEFSEHDINRIVRDLLPFLKGMTKELLGNDIFDWRGGDVKRRFVSDGEPKQYALKMGREVKRDVVLPSREYLERVGLSYIQRGVFFTLLLYRYVFIDEDTSSNVGRLSEAATYGLAIGTNLVRRVRNGGNLETSDRYLRIQRVPRLELGTIDLEQFVLRSTKRGG